MQLKFPAALGIIFYSIGFPMTVLFLTWYYRIQMKADQLLRAYDLGDERYAALDGMQFTPRPGRSKSRKTYDKLRRSLFVSWLFFYAVLVFQ